MNGTQAGLSAYLRRVSRALDCPPARRRALMDKVRRDAGELVGGRRAVSEAEAAASLGDPTELAQGLLETLDQQELERYRHRRKLLFRAAVVLLIAALIYMGRWAIQLYTAEYEVIEVLEIYPPTDQPRGLP